MLSQIQFQMLHCDVFQQHPLVGIEQIETGNRFQVVEPVTVDDLRSIAGVEHAWKCAEQGEEETDSYMKEQDLEYERIYRILI